jgi:hypothetical protein
VTAVRRHPVIRPWSSLASAVLIIISDNRGRTSQTGTNEVLSALQLIFSHQVSLDVIY